MTRNAAHFDFETFSAIDIKVGVDVYAAHETSGVWCLAYRIGDGPVKIWRPEDADPEDLLAYVRDGGTLVAHNARFDRTVWNKLVRRRFRPHWPELPLVQTDCTMARCLAMGLPGALDAAVKALSATVQKDAEGHKLMMRMCRPRGIITEKDKHWAECLEAAERDAMLGTPLPEYTLHGATIYRWWVEPDKRARLERYCAQDIVAETTIDEAVPLLSAREREIWLLDQTINDRGVAIDADACERMEQAVKIAKEQADLRLWEITDGFVRKTTDLNRMLAFVRKSGIETETLRKDDFEEIIAKADVIGDPTVAEVIEIRRAAGKTSNQKYKAMTGALCADGRSRGVLQYHAASATGRWGGRIWQPQNLPRVDEDRDWPDVDFMLRVLRKRDRGPGDIVEAATLISPAPLVTFSKMLRPMIVAGPGKKLVGGDFSNIEGRLNAWFGQEDWKLQAFRDFDAGTGPDLYKVMASEVLMKRLEDVTKAERQSSGKVPELACGYQGGRGAFHTMAANYGVTVSDETADRTIKAWRAKHPGIVQSWWDGQDAAIAAVNAPGTMHGIMDGKVTYLAAHGFLYCRLPSGRVMAYASPVIKTVEFNGKPRWQVFYWGLDVNKRWSEQSLYGGLQCNNWVQGAARDLMAEKMLEAEAAGLPLVLTVHDELVAEVDADDDTALERLTRIMSTPPDWAPTLPLACGTWEDERYVK